MHFIKINVLITMTNGMNNPTGFFSKKNIYIPNLLTHFQINDDNVLTYVFWIFF